MKPVWAVVLAAGESRRFGSPKALMPIGKSTALAAVIYAARSGPVAEVVVVTGFDHEPIEAEAARLGARWCRNPEPARGMMSSVRAGVAALPVQTHALVWPVDHPHVGATTVREILACARTASQRAVPVGIIVPTHLGRGGHPTLVPDDLLAEVLHLDDTGGLDRLLRAHVGRVHRLPVTDEGVLRDIDTWEDLL